MKRTPIIPPPGNALHPYLIGALALMTPAPAFASDTAGAVLMMVGTPIVFLVGLVLLAFIAPRKSGKAEQRLTRATVVALVSSIVLVPVSLHVLETEGADLFSVAFALASALVAYSAGLGFVRLSQEDETDGS